MYLFETTTTLVCQTSVFNVMSIGSPDAQQPAGKKDLHYITQTNARHSAIHLNGSWDILLRKLQ